MDKSEIRVRCIEAALKVASAQALRSAQNVVDIATVFEQYIAETVPPALDKPEGPKPRGRPRKSEADNLLS